MEKKPKITIGLPVRNEIKNINNVLDNIFNQSFKNFILVISDNCSSDGTYEICKKRAKKNKKIKLFRQKKEIIRGLNFLYVYKKCITPYFTWMAADDLRSKNFLSSNLSFLERNKKYIASCSPNIIEVKPQKKIIKKFSIVGDNNLNIKNFLKNCYYSHGIFYSLFRYQNINEIEKYVHYFMWDWMFNIFLITKGNFKRINKGFFLTKHGGVSTQQDYITKYKKNFIEVIFPPLIFTLYVIKKINFSKKKSINILFELLHLFFVIQKKWIKNFFYTKS